MVTHIQPFQGFVIMKDPERVKYEQLQVVPVD
jgi:hypothetical protein